MTANLAFKDRNGFAEGLQELTKLSKEMNDAVQQKDLPEIEQVHFKKQALINKLNLMIIAETSTRKKE
jgi:hypothetical protein